MVTNKEKKHFKSIIEKDVMLSLSSDPNGCFVIQKLLKILNEEDREDLYNIIIDDIDNFINNQEGIKMVHII
jgi:hypothetical protein